MSISPSLISRLIRMLQVDPHRTGDWWASWIAGRQCGLDDRRWEQNRQLIYVRSDLLADNETDRSSRNSLSVSSFATDDNNNNNNNRWRKVEWHSIAHYKSNYLFQAKFNSDWLDKLKAELRLSNSRRVLSIAHAKLRLVHHRIQLLIYLKNRPKWSCETRICSKLSHNFQQFYFPSSSRVVIN